MVGGAGADANRRKAEAVSLQGGRGRSEIENMDEDVREVRTTSRTIDLSFAKINGRHLRYYLVPLHPKTLSPACTTPPNQTVLSEPSQCELIVGAGGSDLAAACRRKGRSRERVLRLSPATNANAGPPLLSMLPPSTGLKTFAVHLAPCQCGSIPSELWLPSCANADMLLKLQPGHGIV